MSPGFRRKWQALVLFVVCPIGMLGAYAQLESPQDRNIPQALAMAIIAVLGFLLGIWLWRKKEPLDLIDADVIEVVQDRKSN